MSLIKMLILEENFKRHLEAFASELFLYMWVSVCVCVYIYIYIYIIIVLPGKEAHWD